MIRPNPIIDPQRPHTRWSLDEIYNGSDTGGEYTPNPDDEVWSWSGGLYRVVAVDYQTGLSTLEKHLSLIHISEPTRPY